MANTGNGRPHNKEIGNKSFKFIPGMGPKPPMQPQVNDDKKIDKKRKASSRISHKPENQAKQGNVQDGENTVSRIVIEPIQEGKKAPFMVTNGV